MLLRAPPPPPTVLLLPAPPNKVHATGIVKETGKKFWSTKDAGQQPFTYQVGSFLYFNPPLKTIKIYRIVTQIRILNLW